MGFKWLRASVWIGNENALFITSKLLKFSIFSRIACRVWKYSRHRCVILTSIGIYRSEIPNAQSCHC